MKNPQFMLMLLLALLANGYSDESEQVIIISDAVQSSDVNYLQIREQAEEQLLAPPQIVYINGWTEERVKNIKSPNRPDPKEYLSADYIANHLKNFRYGASKVVPKATLEKYDTLGAKGGVFVLPKSQLDQLLTDAKGSVANLEKALGIIPGTWKDRKLCRVDVPFPEKFNLRLPSGNESGANDLWIPGGLLPGGLFEAVIDPVPKSDYQQKELDLK